MVKELIFSVCLLVCFSMVIHASTTQVSRNECREWLRYIIPLPHEIAIEKKILSKVAESVQVDDTEYVEKLTDWADIIRKTFVDGGVDEIISTRRLVHIIKAYAIFNDRMTAIEMCTNRFDEETKLAFRDLYTKLDAGVISAEQEDEIDSIIEDSETTGEY